MDIGALGTGRASCVGAATWSGASRRMGGGGATGRMQAAIGAVSQLLNMPAGDLVRQLGSGQSLTSVAAGRGVSAGSVLAAVSRAVSATVPQGRTPLSGNLLTDVSSRIANSTGVPRGFSVTGG